MGMRDFTTSLWQNGRMETIFSKIISREIPASIVFEDERVLAFLDINPITKGHTLVIPKIASRNIFDTDPETLGHLIGVAQKIALALKEATNADGINILMNNEESAGQEIFHAHIHIVPRKTGDNAFHKTPHVAYEEGEMDSLYTEVKNLLSR